MDKDNFSALTRSGEKKIKCGEVYRNPEGTLEVQCLVCSTEIKNLEIFSEHIALHWDNEIVRLGSVKNGESIDQAIPTPTNKTTIKEECKDYDDFFDDGFDTSKDADAEFDDKSNFAQLFVEELSAPVGNNDTTDNVDRPNVEQQTEEKTIKCKMCLKMFYCMTEKHIHESVHDIINFSCDICPFASSAKRKLVKHLMVNHKMKAKKYKQAIKCKHCNTSFATENEFQRHKKDKKPRKYRKKKNKSTRKKPQFSSTCGVHCTMEFSSKLELYKHYNKYNLKPFICKDCPRKFANISAFEIHLRQHSGDKPYKCKLCDKDFSCTSYLNIHLRLHSAEKAYQCEQCGDKFKLSTQLSFHRKNHNGVHRNKVCDLCGRGFRSNYDLDIHKRTHTGEKPFKCDLCEKYFISVGVLGVHVQRVHKGIRPFTCRHDCNMTFLYATSRILHEKKCNVPKATEENLFETERKGNKT